MAQRRRNTEHDPPPADQADVISFEKAVRERPRKTEIPVEVYLLGNNGREGMEGLYATVDQSDNIIEALGDQLFETKRRMVETDDDITTIVYGIFNHEHGIEGLTRPELTELFRHNPLLDATLAAVQAKHRDKDHLAKHLYTYGFRVFANMVRYEWLLHTYDADDPIWGDRASRLGDFQGTETTQQGHDHQGAVLRQKTPFEMPSTPSDYLDRLQD